KLTEQPHATIIILDFGSHYTQLIARRIRESGVYCEIWPYHTPAAKIQAVRPCGLILSGGPSSVYDKDAPQLPPGLLDNLDCPVLGICYGLQLLAAALGGEVKPSRSREYGYARLSVTAPDSLLFKGLPEALDVWLSHGDYVTHVPPGFRITAHTDEALNAFEALSSRIYGVQFHPEVAHTPLGAEVLRNFVFEVCHARGDWSARSIIIEQIAHIRDQIGDGRAVCGLSGGVDSTVAAALVHEAIGERQTCLFVNTGLLREGEFEATLRLFQQQMHLRLIEPLRELFKDEVRQIGRDLQVPEEILRRHPFPGPGLAVRILGEITDDNLRLLRAADRILEEELRLANLYDAVWQSFP